MLRIVQFIIGLFLLIALEIFKVYYIMPFSGSQQGDTIDLAYFIHVNIFWFRLVGYLIILFPIVQFFTLGSSVSKVLVVTGLVIYGFVYYAFNYRLLADKMFYEPTNKKFAYASESKVPLDGLVLGIENNGKAKAYPIEIIGYHHQVRDTVGGEPVMVTYCTVCRTGRVFSPEVEGKTEKFRLVGMDQFNAMFEDESTGSWWRQVSGEAVAGPLKGQQLREIFSEQMTLNAWLTLHPASEIMQPDTVFNEAYEDLKGFNNGTIKSGLERRDSLSWKDKSWVVGVELGSQSRAYDWNDFAASWVINDTLDQVPIVLVMQSDTATFHVLKRDTLSFSIGHDGRLTDDQTNSAWTWRGESTDGPLKGTTLPVIQSYQEFWHSWRTFHPKTSQYKKEKN